MAVKQKQITKRKKSLENKHRKMKTKTTVVNSHTTDVQK